MRSINYVLLGVCLLIAQSAFAHGPEPMPLQKVPIPPVPGLLDGSDPIVVNKNMAIALGKALFWDMNVGSDGMACASCHYHAGADRRVKNQLNPGEKSSSPTGQTFEALPSGSGGANHTLTRNDFPTFRFNDPLHQESGVAFATDDVVSSAGTFSGDFIGASKFTGTSDQCARSADPVFHVNHVGTRRVEPRNTPTVINAVFNHRNFWDGRANNIFNGSSPWGDRDPDAGVWVKINARSVVKQRLHLENSSLASQAMGPPLSDSEMSCRQRTWPAIGRKLLLRQPLQHQKVHHEDSVLGPFSLSSPGSLKPGLSTTYKNMITQAFNPKYWSYGGLGPFGAPSGQTPYSQMEANFSMFFGIALQLYQSTLVSDQAPIDLSPRDPQTHRPTWQGMGKTQEEIDVLTDGFQTFVDNHCNLCHAGPTMTTAAMVTNSTLVTPTPGMYFGPDHSLIEYGPNALGPSNGAAAAGINRDVNVVIRDVASGGQRLMDMGFANTGVGDPDADPGVGGVDDFGNPLSFSDQYVQYLLGNDSGIVDPGVDNVRSCDFLTPLALNTNSVISTVFTIPDGIEIDGSREGVLRDQNCLNSLRKYSPTIAAANAALVSAPGKLAVAKKAVFKIPGLRNIELTGPYMHNGSMATLEEVLEFYSRFGNVNNPDKHSLMDSVTLAENPIKRSHLLAFLKTFTDDRVRYEKAPFDHPEIVVPHGHSGDSQSVTAGNPLDPNLATEDTLTIPAVGANGATDPILPFENYLEP
ncbi:cytochrome c peroxidase [Methylocaldum sp.]|uniref:cytochrome c peroxidase n=1 Tax=Methylocaldum sp. TaxID=1969727 RepID=UPI00321FA4ED